MIFGKKNLVRKPSYKKGFRNYEIDFNGEKITIACHGRSRMGNPASIGYWFIQLRMHGEEFGSFSFMPPWADGKFYYGLKTFMNNGGKQKLIRAIYNDFGD